MARDWFVAPGMGSVKLPTKSLLFGEEEEAVVTFMTQNNSILADG